MIIEYTLLIVCLFRAVYSDFFEKYLDYNETKIFLQDISDVYPMITNLYSIGKSVQGRELLVLEISATSKIPLGIPNVKIIGNIHGNEPVGREVILRFIKFLVEEYANGSEVVQKLLNTTRIHLLPSANPDGFEEARKLRGYEECFWDTPGRKNAKGVDLNKNFPHKSHVISQAESDSIKRWMDQIPFVASISLHSGDMVVVYPFDYKYQYGNDEETTSSVTPDDDVFRHLASVYANSHSYMHEGRTCSRNRPAFENGIVNGADWYPMKDGMQDYNYLRKGCMEITIELSCCKYPLPNQLNQIWMENQKAMISWLNEIQLGVKGIVTDAATGEGIMAVLQVESRPITFQTSQVGEYWRILLPGVYKMKIKAVQSGYKENTVIFTVLNEKFSVSWVNVSLESIYSKNSDSTTTTTINATRGIVTNNADLAVTDITYEDSTNTETERYEPIVSFSVTIFSSHYNILILCAIVINIVICEP